MTRSQEKRRPEKVARRLDLMGGRGQLWRVTKRCTSLAGWGTAGAKKGPASVRAIEAASPKRGCGHQLHGCRGKRERYAAIISNEQTGAQKGKGNNDSRRGSLRPSGRKQSNSQKNQGSKRDTQEKKGRAVKPHSLASQQKWALKQSSCKGV